MDSSRKWLLLITTIVACSVRDVTADEKYEILLGFDCDAETPCRALNEFCDQGFCKCLPGFIRNTQHCFPVKNYGESCFFDAQCTTFPLVCAEKKFGRRCDCQKFFVWNAETQECHHAENLSAMVSKLEQKFDYEAKIAANAKAIFPGIVAAGIMVLVIGSVMAMACTVYVCYWGSWKPCCGRERKQFECQASEFEKVDVKEFEKIEAKDVPASSAPLQEV